MDDRTLREIEAFLYHESRLMDENRYAEWLELFAPESEYWIPSDEEDVDPARHVSILYGDRSMLEAHVQRLLDGRAFAQSPPSQMRRLIGNIEADKCADGWQVAANFIVFELRKHQQRLHAGRSEYRLNGPLDDLCIAYKKVLLVGIDEHQENITFLL